MRNGTCTICFAEFKPREGKLYCSNACKQRGYADKKAGAVAPSKDPQNSLETTEKKPTKQFILFYPEFQEYKKRFPGILDEFPLYCFFRKNWTGIFDAEKFMDYIESLGENFWDDFYDNMGHGDVSPARKKYNEFQEKFFGGEEFVVAFDQKS